MLHLKGVRKGHRIKNPKGNGDKVEEDQRTKKNIGESLQKAKETHLVVAAMIATVTFAAGFTMPGGYQSEIGPDQGSAILSRSAAFKAFVITDTLAMAMSSCSVLVLLYSSIHTKWNYMNQISMTFHMVVSLTMWALIAMVVAFITGTYAILGGHSPGLAVAACVLACIFFLGCAIYTSQITSHTPFVNLCSLFFFNSSDLTAKN
ncbi:hypothetical protein ACFX16_027063 [Malus domestica]